MGDVSNLTFDELMLAKPLFDVCRGDLKKAHKAIDALISLQLAQRLEPEEPLELPTPRSIRIASRAVDPEPPVEPEGGDHWIPPEPVSAFEGEIYSEPQEDAQPYDPTAFWEAAEHRRTVGKPVTDDRAAAEEVYFQARILQPWAAVMRPHQGSVEDFIRGQIKAMDDYELAKAINRLGEAPQATCDEQPAEEPGEAA